MFDGNLDILAEQAIEDVYRIALDRWVDDVMPLALPSLTASGELPPDPEAVEQAQSIDVWSQVTDTVIVAGTGLLWSWVVIETLRGMGEDLPDEPKKPPRLDSATERAVADALKVERPLDLAKAYGRVQNSRVLRAAMDRATDAAAERAAGTPSRVRQKLASELSSVDQSEARAVVKLVMKRGSAVLGDVARNAGYDAGAVQNDAVLEGARSTGNDGLEKVWICTIDSRTRPSHWAADGQRAPLDGTFTVGHEELRYPCDPRGSSRETDNCRCRVGVLAADEDIPDEVDRHTERGPGDSTVKNREGSQEDEIERREADGQVRAREDPEGIGRSGINAAGGWVSPSEATYEIEEITMADDETTTLADESENESSEMYRTFTDSVIAVIGEPTSDGRMFANDIDLSFRSFPLPLMWTKQSSMAHLEAFTVGVIETASVSDGKVIASGYLLNSDEANEAADQIAHGVTGPSVDLAATEWMMTDADGNEITEEEWWDLPMDAEIYQTVTKGELIGTTLVSTPAFGQTSISLNSERESRAVALVASAAEDFRPRVYDHRLFENPQLTGPTLLTMGDDGRIYGHVACFGQCHRSIQSECTIAPRSGTNYSMFLTSPAVRLDNGERQPVGRLTVGTGHAPDGASGAVAKAHYDNTGACFALVNIGEDEFGIWISGVAHPTATAEQIEEGLSAPLSGDWRDFGQGLELVAALAVNTPGFAARGRTDNNGRPLALVASLGPAPDTARGGNTLSTDQIADVVRATVIEMDNRTKLAADRERVLKRADAVSKDRLGGLLARAAAL